MTKLIKSLLLACSSDEVSLFRFGIISVKELITLAVSLQSTFTMVLISLHCIDIISTSVKHYVAD